MCLTPLGLHHQYVLFVIKSVLGEWALSMVEVEEGHEFRFRGDLYSQESTFPLVSESIFSNVTQVLKLLDRGRDGKTNGWSGVSAVNYYVSRYKMA